MNILIAEDDIANAKLLELHLRRAGFQSKTTHNGREALTALQQESFDCLLTDWMMPEMDGIELIRKVRKQIRPAPIIIMLTAITTPEGRAFALDSGADAFITKPYLSDDIISVLQNVRDQSRQPQPALPTLERRKLEVLPPFVGVVIATSTGGPEALRRVFVNLHPSLKTAFFIVQHAPKWMLESFAENLQGSLKFPIALAQHGMASTSGHAYLAPGDRHLIINSATLQLQLDDGPPENYVKPAADPLLRSVAGAFGKYSLAVILTGMGRDGTTGASHIRSAGGTIFVQNPEEAVAKNMPKTAISAGLADKVATLDEMGYAISNQVKTLELELAQAQADQRH
jgi:two-component system chemotaxis response regulator CheB